MNNSQKAATKAIALFLSLGMMSSLAGCEAPNTDSDDGDDTSIEQPATQGEDVEGGEDAEGGEGGEDG
ncbi:MAG: hypothetical protein KME09_08215 [Pleurocapsa minor HA4230-MV1]|nr:hypothetical protein [Pleurocapsa minor HA4230-MV1]